jgi:hypothetical protein
MDPLSNEIQANLGEVKAMYALSDSEERALSIISKLNRHVAELEQRLRDLEALAQVFADLVGEPAVVGKGKST